MSSRLVELELQRRENNRHWKHREYLPTHESMRKRQENPYDFTVFRRIGNYAYRTASADFIRCRECNELYPAERRYFPVDDRYPLGHENHCRDCKAGYMREYRKRRRHKSA